MAIDAGDDFQQKVKAITPIIAMIIVAVLEIVALYMGYDGALLAAVVAIISGLGGFTAKEIYELWKKQ